MVSTGCYDYFAQLRDEITQEGETTQMQLRAEMERRERERSEREARLLLAPPGGAFEPIPLDLYSTRAVPGSGTERGRNKLRETFRYWHVLQPTEAVTILGRREPTEDELHSWGKFLNKYIEKEFRKPLKAFIKTKMVNEMVCSTREGPGITFKRSKTPPNNFSELKKYIREEMALLPTDERNSVLERLFRIMYGMFRAKNTDWMVDECNKLLEKKRLRCKFLGTSQSNVFLE